MKHLVRLSGLSLLAVILFITAVPALAFDTVQNGDRGSAVQEVQEQLNALGYSVGTADGVFGGKSEAAVKKFQQDHDLDATGVVDEATWNALFGTASADAEEKADQAGGIALPEYEPVPDAASLTELMDPIMKYVDPAADGKDGIDGAVCVNMYYGTKIMRWYHLYLDAGDQSNLAATANTVLQEGRAEIIVHAMADGVVEQYPEMKEKFAAALSAAKLALDESAAPYLEDMGILSKVNWFDAEVSLVEKAVSDGFDSVLNSEALNP